MRRQLVNREKQQEFMLISTRHLTQLQDMLFANVYRSHWKRVSIFKKKASFKEMSQEGVEKVQCDKHSW